MNITAHNANARMVGRRTTDWWLAWLLLFALPAFGQAVLDYSFAPVVNDAIRATALQADGKLLVGGYFTEADGAPRSRIARFNADGTLDTGFAGTTIINDAIFSIVPLPDGKILIGGKFSQVGSPTLQAREGIARLNADGTLDTTFTPPVMTANGGNRVYRLLRLASGRILVAGQFTDIGGTGRTKIARLNASGALDTGFAAVSFGNADNWIWALTEQPDGKILIGGGFDTVGGASHRNIARLDAGGAVDTSFTIGVYNDSGGSVSRVLTQTDGKIVVAGDIATATGNSGATTTIGNLARFNTDLTVDEDFLATTNAQVHWMEMQADGNLLVGGDFDRIMGSTPRSKLARFLPDYGQPDDDFVPPENDGGVWTLIQRADGRIVVGGDFDFVGGDVRNCLALVVQVEPMTGVQAISAGFTHTCAVQSGAARCWGDNGYGQLGNGSTVDSRLPVQVSGLDRGVQAISAGFTHTCAVQNGAAKCWGRNRFGQLGNGGIASSSTPVQVLGLDSGVAAISAGNYHTCALTTAGVVECWGFDTVTGGNNTLPVPVSGLASGVGAISVGGHHSCAVTADGAAKCWGRGDYGELGDGGTVFGDTPVQVSGLVSGVKAIAAGYSHNCAVTEAGAAECWGYGASGQLGNGNGDGSFVPVQVSGLVSGMRTITAGFSHSCATTEAGAALCWGAGRLGNGGTGGSSTPVQVSGLASGVQAISAGGSFTCAVTEAGAVKCWGYGAYGQLGDNTVTSRNTPVSVLVPLPAPSHDIFVDDFE